MKNMAGRKKHSADDIVRKLRRADDLAAAGKTNEEIAAELSRSVCGIEVVPGLVEIEVAVPRS